MMEEKEILDMLFDFADCFGADKLTVENDEYDYVVSGKLSNGELLYAYTPREVKREYVTISVNRKDSLGLTSFYHGGGKNVEYNMNQFVHNYCARKDRINQSDLKMFGNIDVVGLEGAVNIWL